MRTGIEKSRNLMTIRLAHKIGMTKILETARDFKIDQYMDKNLSMSLGAGSVSLINLTNTPDTQQITTVDTRLLKICKIIRRLSID